MTAKPDRIFTPDEIHNIRLMRRTCMPFKQVALNMRATTEEIIALCRSLPKEKWNPSSPVESIKVPADVDADRARRKELRDRQNTTQAFFGDPPAGYSALDKKQRARA